MEGSRVWVIQRKPTVVFDKSFAVFKELDVGMTGQMMITGTVEGERMEFQDDGVDMVYKTVRLETAEVINNKNARI